VRVHVQAYYTWCCNTTFFYQSSCSNSNSRWATMPHQQALWQLLAIHNILMQTLAHLSNQHKS
jgi:hypothetical protein